MGTIVIIIIVVAVVATVIDLSIRQYKLRKEINHYKDHVCNLEACKECSFRDACTKNLDEVLRQEFRKQEDIPSVCKYGWIK
jgi:hypothetical protein